MKRFFTAFLAFITISATSIAFISCNKEEIKNKLKIKNINISVPVNDYDMVAGGLKGLKVPKIELDLNVDLDQELQKQTPVGTIDNIKKATLQGFEVIKKNSSTGLDMTLIKSAELWVKSPNFPETKIGKIVDNKNPDKLILDVSEGKDIDLINYLKDKEGKKLILKKIEAGQTGITKFIVDFNIKFQIDVALIP